MEKNDPSRIKTYLGRPIEDLSKEELIEAISNIASYYRSRLGGLESGMENIMKLRSRR